MQDKNCSFYDMASRYSGLKLLLMGAGLGAAFHMTALGGMETGNGAPRTPAVKLSRRAGTKHSTPLEFQATAYSDTGVTASGVLASVGLVAADPSVLPLGSLIHVDSSRYRGIFQVMDTGALIKGRIIDIFVPDIEEALEFGRQKVRVIVLRYGFPEPARDPTVQ